MNDYIFGTYLEMIDYNNIDQLKALYSNMYTGINLYEKFKQGNQAYASIYIDLKNALEAANIKAKQKYCIVECLLKRSTLTDVGIDLNIAPKNVSTNINSGLKKINKYLVN